MSRKEHITQAITEHLTHSEVERDGKFWIGEIYAAQKKIKQWQERAKKTYEIYVDKAGSESKAVNLNLFNSNTSILLAALYARIPEPDVARRFHDSTDQVGRVASMILQRALSYELETDHYFDTVAKNIILDRLVAGAGVGWVRYDCESHEEEISPALGDFQLTDSQDELTEDVEPETKTVIDHEDTPIDYVHWKDFFWSPARTWDEVTWVARRVYMDRQALISRFGEDTAKLIPVATDETNDSKVKLGEAVTGKSEIYEVWDKTTKTVYFVSLQCDELLDEVEDPLGLTSFFPTPKPLFANLTTEELMPVPDYTLHQTLYKQAENLNNRITKLTSTIRTVGVFDKKQGQLQQLLSETPESEMIGVENWQNFSEAGGMKGSMDFLPIEQPAAVLANLRAELQSTKEQIYELTGISDIIRGESQQYVTAQAESMKGQYASSRILPLQQSIAQYFSELINLKAQIICKLYEPQRILERAGQLFPSDMPYVQSAIDLLKNEGLLHFRVVISVDSLQMPDWNADKKSKTELLTAVTQYMGQVIPAAQATPELAPLALTMLGFAVTGYKGADQIEGVIEDMKRQLTQLAQQKAANPQPPKPSPEEVQLQLQQAKMQADQERAKDQLALDQQRAASDAQIAQMKAQSDNQLAAQKLQLEQAKIDLERQRLILEQKKLVADVHLKMNAPAATTAAGMQAIDNGASMDQVLPMGDMDSQVQNLVAQERDRHFSKDEFMSLAGQMLHEMRSVADEARATAASLHEAINTAVNAPMPAQTIEIMKTDNGLRGTIQ